MSGNEADSDHEVEFDPFGDLDGGGVLTADDPLAFTIPEGVEPDSIGEETQEAVSSAVATIGKGSIFVYDLETVPDESRFPRPVRVEKVKRPDLPGISLAKLVTLTVPAIKAQIPKLSEEQLTSLHESESNSKKPRVGVLDAIDKQIAADNADDHEIAMMEWRKLSFSPLCCKVVALSIEARGHSVTMIAKNEAEERELIIVLWEHVANYETRCGYNITAFDDAVLIFRSMLLGIDAPKKISRKKFNSRECLDLMTAMFPSSSFGGGKKKKSKDDEDESDEDDFFAEPAIKTIDGQSRKLKDVCFMLGIVPLAGYEMSGDQVFDLVESGDWDGIAKYVHSDAVIEFELYRRLNEYMVF